MVYVNGHGLAGKYIAGLSIEKFQKILDFFENKVRTKIPERVSALILEGHT